MAESFIARLGYQGPIATITGSIDRQDIFPEFPCRNIDVIFVGRLVAVKRPGLIIDVIANIKNRIPGVKCVFIGDGPLMGELHDTIKAKNLESNIDLLGVKNNVRDYLNKSKVFLLTSEDEGMSIAMLEAMSAGVVPVVADIGDLRDIVVNSETGFLIDRPDEELFAEKCIELLSDETQWRGISARAAISAEDYSSTESVARKWNEYIAIVRESRGMIE